MSLHTNPGPYFSHRGNHPIKISTDDNDPHILKHNSDVISNYDKNSAQDRREGSRSRIPPIPRQIIGIFGILCWAQRGRPYNYLTAEL